MSSVRANKREESKIQYLIDLKKLCCDITELLNSHPKGQNDTLKETILTKSIDALVYARTANDTFISDIDPISDYNIRKENFLKAKGTLESLGTYIDVYIYSTKDKPKINTGKLLKKTERFFMDISKICASITKIMKYDTTKCKEILARKKHIIVDTNPLCEKCDNKTLLLKDLKKEIYDATQYTNKKIDNINKISYTGCFEYTTGLIYNDPNKKNTKIRKAVVFLDKENLDYIIGTYGYENNDPGYFHDIIKQSYSTRNIYEDDGNIKITCPNHLNFSTEFRIPIPT